MLAPLLLVLGAPITLALQAGGRRTQRRLLRLLRSPPVALLAHPVTIWMLFGGTLVALYFTGLYELSLRNDAVHALVHVHFIVVGFLFTGYVVGVDPLGRTLGYGARLLYVALVLPFHAFLGVALLSSSTVLASGWYSQVMRSWGTSALDDQRLGAGILWGAGELFGVAAAAVVLHRWMRAEERAGRRADRGAYVRN
jgi:cytochrome c oxidase assembly factor CtaG